MKRFVVITFATLFITVMALPISAQVVVVEPGHVLNQMVDSTTPIDPSQDILESGIAADESIESIGVDPASGNLYIQLIFPLGNNVYTSDSTDIFRVTPSAVVSPVALTTRFGINSRGTDLYFDPTTGLLVTQDQNFLDANGVPGRVATVNPTTGAIGTWTAPFPPFATPDSTFGVDGSTGAGGSDVPTGEIVFTGDISANGIHSAPLGGPVVTHLPLPPLPGDDLVVQPDGDWVHVGDFTNPITAYNPAGPEPHATAVSALSLQTMFNGADLAYVFGSRATVCDSTGDLYVSYSGYPGGNGVFRVNEALTTATLILTIGAGPDGTEGLQDLTVGPSTAAFAGNSLYFTVHNLDTRGEEVWEATLPECPGGRNLDGRMTGGGSVFDAAGTRFTHGFELHCDASVGPNNLEINWPKAGKGSNRFHLDALASALCTDQPGISEGKPVAGFDTYIGSGSGSMNGVPGATIDFFLSDAGEPGGGVDVARFSITPPGGGAPIVVAGVLDRGNHQAH